MRLISQQHFKTTHNFSVPLWTRIRGRKGETMAFAWIRLTFAGIDSFRPHSNKVLGLILSSGFSVHVLRCGRWPDGSNLSVGVSGLSWC